MSKTNQDREHVLVTTLGADRPGIVEDVSAWLLAQSANIEDSRMARLGGEFATLILASGAVGLIGRLDATRAEFESSRSLTVYLKAVSAAPPVPAQPVLRYSLTATSFDHPGIVHQAAAVLRRRLINIASADTRTTPAPFTGTPVFHFRMELDIPADVPLGALREELRELGDRERIDFVLKPAE